MFGIDFNTLVYTLPAVVIALTVHEFCHALASLLLGDTTARTDGRLTLNPLRHIDPLGMLVLLIAGFGWARPVRFDPANLKNPRRDRILVALAGPASNLILGILFLLIIKLFMVTDFLSPLLRSELLVNFLLYTGVINLSLFLFNMIPIPPLDGSHVIFSSIHMDRALEAKLYRYGSLVLLAIILLQNNTGVEIIPIGRFIRFIISLVF